MSQMEKPLPSNSNVEYSTFKYRLKDALSLDLGLLSQAEFDYLRTLTHPKRKTEFLSSHLLLQNTFQKLQLSNRKLVRKETGQWCFKEESPNQSHSFSISHCEDCIFIGISQNPIGVDVQKIKPESSPAFYKKIFHLNEAQVLKANSDLEYCVFSMKESYGKSKGRGLQNVSELDFSKYLKTDFKYLNFLEPTFEMTVERVDNFVYTSCVQLTKD